METTKQRTPGTNAEGDDETETVCTDTRSSTRWLDAAEFVRLVVTFPSWLRRREHRLMLLAMARRILKGGLR